jgi:hypothetical protein
MCGFRLENSGFAGSFLSRAGLARAAMYITAINHLNQIT